MDILYYFLGERRLETIKGILRRDLITEDIITSSKVSKKIDLSRLKNIYINFVNWQTTLI